MIEFVKSTVLQTLIKLNVDTDHNGMISHEEMAKIVQEPVCIKSFAQIGVDVIGLCDLTDYIFADGQELPFGAFMELVMELRGTNVSTVKDIVDLRKFVLLEIRNARDDILDSIEILYDSL